MTAIKCSVCGKMAEYALRTYQDPKTKIWKCEHDVASIGASSTLEAQRKLNRESTIEAQMMAGRAAREQDARDPIVTLTNRDNETPSDQFSGPAQVRKSTLDKLTEKAEQAIDSGQLDPSQN